MASKMIGIEIGNDTVKLAVCNGGTVTNMAVERLQENMVHEGKISSPDAMSSFIKQMRKEHRIPGGNAALVLPPRAVITNIVTMPPMSDQELSMNLPFEFRDYVGQDSAKYLYDYAVMESIKNSAGQTEKLEVFSAAVRKDLIDSYFSILKKAGLTLKVAVPAEMALLNLVRSATKEPKELCIVDVGHTSTRVYIYANGRFMMGKEIEMGGQHFDDIIASETKVDRHVARTYKESNLNDVLSLERCVDAYNALAVEVMKAVYFYNSYDNHSGNLQDLYFCGGMSYVEPLRTAIKKNTDFIMHHINRLAPGADGDPNKLFCALAAGAAMQ